MLPKIFIFCLNALAIKLVHSQTIYNALPTCSYPSSSVSAMQSYPVGVSPVSPLPSNVPTATIAAISAVSASPVAGSPIATIAASPTPMGASPVPITVSPMPKTSSLSAATEAKAYFVPGPIPDPKITILGDMPALVEVTPKIYPDSPVLADPGYIEVKATLCKDPVPNLTLPAARNPVLPAKENSPINPVKRMTMACANDDLFIAHKTSLGLNQPVCPGISKMDLIPASAVTKSNPIDFDGLLDSFITCL